MATTPERPTPANPIPGVTRDLRQPEHAEPTLPPGLPDAVRLFDGRAFMYSDATGDVPPSSIGGLIVNDTRLISRWELQINDRPLIRLRANVTSFYSAAFFLTNQAHPRLPANTLDVRRTRLLARDSFREEIRLQSFAAVRVRVEVRLRTGADFADLFELRSRAVRDRSAQVIRSHAADGSHLSFAYCTDQFAASVRAAASPPASRVEGDDLIWAVELDRHQRYLVELSIPLELGPIDLPSVFVANDNGPAQEDPVTQWHTDRPHLDCGSSRFTQILIKSAEDLLALRMRARIGGAEVVLPAAGAPWFLTLFGRDTLITSYQVMGGNPHLARGTLVALARLQGRRCDDFTDEEPGRILHESRNGELTQTGQRPYSPYYGTADATQLWLIVLSEYWRWTGDDGFVRQLRDNILAALHWIDRYGDRDGDGYVEYATRSPHGLGNQCWRDSWDGVQFANGDIPVLPIATCELQGYVYDAKRRVAALAEGPLADPALAARLRDEAKLLSERFNRDFWIEGRGGYYAVGLDADKRKIDSMTSNMGHLLWSGIVPSERAPIVARQLMSEAVFSGWGLRSMSTLDRGYNPLGYHTGTVWPHDTSLAVQGLTQYGFRAEANRLAMGLVHAAEHFDFRLPEVFAGYSREDVAVPVAYPTPCIPQAWASGAPLQLVGSILGLDSRDNEIFIDPEVPDEIGWIRIRGLHAFQQRWDIEASESSGRVSRWR